MAIVWITDKACGCVSLRNACISISTFFLISTILNIIIRPSYLSYSGTLIGFIIALLGNAALLYGAIKENKWFVLAWLISAVLFFVGWPIGVLGVIFNFGGYRQASNFDNIFLILLEYIVILALFSYCTYIVWSFFNYLKNRDSKPAHSVVV